MKHTYSLNSLSHFSHTEELEFLKELGMEKRSKSPSELSIQKILGFSKSLSVRKTKHYGLIEHHLN